MKKYIKTLLLTLMCLLGMPMNLNAEQSENVDSMQISLLTCGPGDLVYELYGHTALRVQHLKTGEDLIFNYGIFDFDTPNFAWRFMLGQTDYKLGVTYFDRFAYSYARHGRFVDEQVLNLTPNEEARLWEALKKNWSDEYWTYRYNFLYDNCTTRAIAQIKSCLDGELVWPAEEDGKRSFREMLHEFTGEASPWNSFGQDLILGAEIDQPIYVEQQLFSPIYAERFVDRAYIKGADGTQRPLVSKKQQVVEIPEKEISRFPVSPMAASVLLLILVVIVSVWEIRRKHLCFALDYTLMFLQGVAGCMVAFLFFLSEHPAVGSNWLIVLLNPLPLLYIPFKVWRDRKGKME